MAEQTVTLFDEECTGDVCLAIPRDIVATLDLNYDEKLTIEIVDGALVLRKVAA